jgi:hypothetical protein
MVCYNIIQISNVICLQEWPDCAEAGPAALPHLPGKHGQAWMGAARPTGGKGEVLFRRIQVNIVSLAQMTCCLLDGSLWLLMLPLLFACNSFHPISSLCLQVVHFGRCWSCWVASHGGPATIQESNYLHAAEPFVQAFLAGPAAAAAGPGVGEGPGGRPAGSFQGVLLAVDVEEALVKQVGRSGC